MQLIRQSRRIPSAETTGATPVVAYGPVPVLNRLTSVHCNLEIGGLSILANDVVLQSFLMRELVARYVWPHSSKILTSYIAVAHSVAKCRTIVQNCRAAGLAMVRFAERLPTACGFLSKRGVQLIAAMKTIGTQCQW